MILFPRGDEQIPILSSALLNTNGKFEEILLPLLDNSESYTLSIISLYLKSAENTDCDNQKYVLLFSAISVYVVIKHAPASNGLSAILTSVNNAERFVGPVILLNMMVWDLTSVNSKLKASIIFVQKQFKHTQICRIPPWH